jgi:hypothetical protein
MNEYFRNLIRKIYPIMTVMLISSALLLMGNCSVPAAGGSAAAAGGGAGGAVATRVIPTGATTVNALAPCTLAATGVFALSCIEVSHSKINMADTTGVTITAALGATGLTGTSVLLEGKITPITKIYQ